MQKLTRALHSDNFEVFVENDDSWKAVEEKLLSDSQGKIIVEKKVKHVWKVFQRRGLQVELELLLRLLVTNVDELDFLFDTVAMLYELCKPERNLLRLRRPSSAKE